jgi:hypothetical protein
LVFPPKY